MFVKRKIRVEVEGTSNANFEGLRTLVRVENAGAPYGAVLDLTIYGLSLDHINDLSTKGRLVRPGENYTVTVWAGDNVNGMSRVFKGKIVQSWGDMTNMPDVAFHIVANGSSTPAVVGPANPTSATGGVQVAPLIEKLAKAGGLDFVNQGVTKKLWNVYHWGSPWKQMLELARAANINIAVDDLTAKIWNKGEALSGTFVVSPSTGMRDYPSFTLDGIHVKIEFSRAIDYHSTIIVQSDLKDANASWVLFKVDYDLAAELPGGPWYAILDAKKVGSDTRYQGSGRTA